MNQTIAWRNGTLLPADQAAVPVHDLGVVAGAAVTEMARTFGHRTFRLERHLDRLCSSLHALGFPCAFDAEALATAVDAVLRSNLSLISPADDLGIVVFSTAGSNPTYGARASDATTMVHTFLLPFASWRESFQYGVRLRIVAQRQLSADVFPTAHKTRNRLHWWLADQEAARIEPGSRALLLDETGCVTETSTSCVIAVRDGKLLTPQRNVLNSLSRRIIQELAEGLSLPFVAGDLTPDDLMTASEVCVASTPVCMLPVSHIDGRAIGDGCPGPVFQQLIKSWSELVGIDLARQMVRGD